ncbi:hypothetical protein [Litorilituus lipolyticus]|uniref:Uncharacterized protein n=1 Tax=Litorilituus lipolyticus TaxID=2491017 RepID=A0A502L611_9GAMM|nr:hypothetical protein [Litorilituus lipolyticus]TPH19342.1 hypothetical protein EPA86_01040 [Litorilituus lipolyticus]
MTQTSLWQGNANSSDHAELCNGLYEREIRLIAQANYPNVQAIQGRLKSLTHYINRAAYLMLQVESPLQLDIQNASWSAKQGNKPPYQGQSFKEVNQWYTENDIPLGLVIPILVDGHLIVDCIDRVDSEKKRIRTNIAGWFNLTDLSYCEEQPYGLPKAQYCLFKPTKRMMLAACSGHCWQKGTKQRPVMPSLRELLLSCNINWKNFKKTLK